MGSLHDWRLGEASDLPSPIEFASQPAELRLGFRRQFLRFNLFAQEPAMAARSARSNSSRSGAAYTAYTGGKIIEALPHCSRWPRRQRARRDASRGQTARALTALEHRAFLRSCRAAAETLESLPQTVRLV